MLLKLFSWGMARAQWNPGSGPETLTVEIHFGSIVAVRVSRFSSVFNVVFCIGFRSVFSSFMASVPSFEPGLGPLTLGHPNGSWPFHTKEPTAIDSMRRVLSTAMDHQRQVAFSQTPGYTILKYGLMKGQSFRTPKR